MPDSKTVVVSHFDAGWVKKDFGSAYRLVANDAVVHLFSATLQGLEAWKQLEGQFHSAFPDLRTTRDFAIAEGDKVAIRWRAVGTHSGAFQGIPPSGKRIEISGCAVYRVAGDKIVEGWAHPDMLGLMQQVGAVPQPAG